jgi:aminomethyltransferase
MVPFAGWDMPVEYSGISAEHMAVRTRAGLFDVSHMGQIEVAGKNAAAAVDRVVCSDASALKIGQVKYSGLLTPDGTFVDDVLVYRMAPSHFMFVANASNVKKDYAWISEQIKSVGDAAAVDSSSRYALLALQGPASREVLQPLTGVELSDIKPYWFANGEVANARATISRTGYSGEDGFEIFVPPNMAERVWQAVLESGRSAEVIPAVLVPATRCVWKPRCVSTAMTSTNRRRFLKPVSIGQSPGTRQISSGETASQSSAARASGVRS